jgi:CRISPR/Cas system CMR-associated protein Cmr3 (group 5 of RAMP superfamily)
MKNLFKEYENEIIFDTKIDELNLLQKQLELPAIKHKWIFRLINHKRELNNLLKKRKEIKEVVLQKLDCIPKGIPKKIIESKIDSSEQIQIIDQEISEINIMIEYLEKIEHIFKTMSYDLKNIVDITKLETT